MVDGFRYWMINDKRRLASVSIKVLAVVAIGILVGFALVHFSSQILVVIAAGVLLVLFFIQPEKFLLGYLVLFPILDELTIYFTTMRHSLRLGPQIVFRGGLIVLLVYYWLFNRRNPLGVVRGAIYVFIFLFLLALSTVAGGIEVQLGLTVLAKLLLWMILILTVADIVSLGKIDLKTIYRCIIVSILLVVTMLSGFDLLGIGGVDKYEVGAVTADLGHGVAFALSCGLVVTLAMSTYQQSMLSMMTLLALSTMITVSILRTYIRTGYVSLVVAFVALVLLFWRYERGKRSLRSRAIFGGFSIIIIVAIAIFVVTHTEQLQYRFRDFRFDNPSELDSAGSGRVLLYKRIFRAYTGYSVFEKMLGKGGGAAYTYYGRPFATHNDYFEILLSTGALGLCLYLWLFISFWRQMRSSAENEPLPFIIAGATIWVYLTSAMVNGTMHGATMAYLSFLVGGALGYYYRIERNAGIVPETNLDSPYSNASTESIR